MKDLKRAIKVFGDIIKQEIKNNNIAINYDIKPSGTFKALKESFKKHNALAYDDSYSEQTIFNISFGLTEAKHLNALFRVWHDWIHINKNLNFSTEHEALVCSYHKEATIKYCSANNIPTKILNLILVIINLEINGQRKYYNTFGDYVYNQKEFLLTNLLQSNYKFKKD